MLHSTSIIGRINLLSMEWRRTRSKDECFYNIKPDVSISVPFYAVGYAHNPKENRKDKVYSPLAFKCRFIGFAIDVNWSLTIGYAIDESYFVNYKDSYIICDRITRPWITRPARCQSKDHRIERVNLYNMIVHHQWLVGRR